MFDRYTGDSLLIAATNHETNLDSAVWRRFEEILCFTLPEPEQISKLLEIKLRGVRRNFKKDISEIAKCFDTLSHADIERILRRSIKDMILNGKEFLEEYHIERAIENERARKKVIN